MHKCHFGATEIDFIGRIVTSKGVKPQEQNVQNLFEKTNFPKSKDFFPKIYSVICVFLTTIKIMSQDYPNASPHSTRC